MDNITVKKIVLKKETISYLNDPQMGVLLGARNVSAQTLNGANCDTVFQCCTMFADCVPTIYTCDSCNCTNNTCKTCTCILSVCPCGGVGDSAGCDDPTYGC